DIGLAKDAFLYAGDYTASRGVEAAPPVLPAVDDEDQDVEIDEAEPPRREAVAPIEQMLTRGQEVLVQVSKESLGSKGPRVTSPAVLHEEADLTFRVVRDLVSPEIDEFVVDSAEVYDKCLGYVRALVPALAERVRLYTERAPVFDHYGIEKDIEKALRRRVWLKSGGYIVIDHTEALVSIDVNTGKYVGKRDFEQTVLKINMEAVGEVVRQIRL